MKFFRYLIVQISAYGIDIGMFWVLFKLVGSGPLLANAVAKIVSGVVCFLVHRAFTFDVAHNSSSWKQALSYFTLLSLNVPFSSLVLSIVMAIIHHEMLAKFISDLICVGLTYGLSKRFVFERSGRQTSDSEATRRKI